MTKLVSLLCALVVIAFAVTGCGKKEEPKAVAQAPTPASGGSSSSVNIDCSLAPSQSKVVSGIVGAAGGTGVTAAMLSSALGLTAVTHSSGALILTGSGGYVAGTLGTAIAGPVIVGVGLVVAGSAVTVEVLCAPTNHPAEAQRVREAADEFARRSKISFSEGVSKAGKVAEKAVIQLQKVSGDVFDYAFRN